MSENAGTEGTEAAGTAGTETPQEGTESQGETFDAEYVAKLRKEAAKYRTEAKANADAAKRLAELDERDKSAEQKNADRIKQLENDGTASELRALRAEVALAKGLTSDQAKRLVGNTREELEADAGDLLKDIAGIRKQGNHVPTEGTTPPPGEAGDRNFARSLFSDG